jgi:hypothetical protein
MATTYFHSLKCQVSSVSSKDLFFSRKNFKNFSIKFVTESHCATSGFIGEADDTVVDVLGGDPIALAEARNALAEARDALAEALDALAEAYVPISKSALPVEAVPTQPKRKKAGY